MGALAADDARLVGAPALLALRLQALGRRRRAGQLERRGGRRGVAAGGGRAGAGAPLPPPSSPPGSRPTMASICIAATDSSRATASFAARTASSISARSAASSCAGERLSSSSIGAGRAGPRPPRLHAPSGRGAPVASARAAPRRPSRAPRRPRARRQAASIALSSLCERRWETRKRRPAARAAFPRGAAGSAAAPTIGRSVLQPRFFAWRGEVGIPYTPAAARYKVPASQEPGAITPRAQFLARAGPKRARRTKIARRTKNRRPRRPMLALLSGGRASRRVAGRRGRRTAGGWRPPRPPPAATTHLGTLLARAQARGADKPAN